MKNTKLLILTGIVAGVALPSLLIAQDLLDGDLGVEFSENAKPLAIEKPADTPAPTPAVVKPEVKATVNASATAEAKTPVVAPAAKTSAATAIKAKPATTSTPIFTPPVVAPSKPSIELPDESEFQMIDGVPFGTTLAAFKAALKPAEEATFEVYDPNGLRPATDLKAGHIVRVVAGDQVSISWYKIIFAPNTDPSFTSKLGIVNDELGVLRDIPFGTSLSTLMTAVVPAPEASCQVFQPDGLTLATDVLEGYLLNCTAGDGVSQKTVTLSFAPNTDASVSTSLGNVDEDGKTITDIPFGTSLEEFKASLVPAPQATIKVLKSDALTEADVLRTGYFLMVSAGDGKHQKKYRIEYAPNTDATVYFSLEALLDLLKGNKK